MASATASPSVAVRIDALRISHAPSAASMKNGTKHQSAYRSTNIGENAYEATSINIGGNHIHASANAVAARARSHPRHVPHPASAAITGKEIGRASCRERV